jgi:hypothetical protein
MCVHGRFPNARHAAILHLPHVTSKPPCSDEQTVRARANLVRVTQPGDACPRGFCLVTCHYATRRLRRDGERRSPVTFLQR